MTPRRAPALVADLCVWCGERHDVDADACGARWCPSCSCRLVVARELAGEALDQLHDNGGPPTGARVWLCLRCLTGWWGAVDVDGQGCAWCPSCGGDLTLPGVTP